MPGKGHDPTGPLIPPQREVLSLASEVLEALRERFDDPVAAWEQLKGEVEPKLAPRVEGSEGATVQPDASTRTRRPYQGFERESATYERLRDEFLRNAEGKYVALVGEEWVGPEDTYGGALRAGYRRFGLGPLYVKQVLAEEPVVEVSREITPCRP